MAKLGSFECDKYFIYRSMPNVVTFHISNNMAAAVSNKVMIASYQRVVYATNLRLIHTGQY